MASKKKATKRAEKRSVKDLSARSARNIKGGAIYKDQVAGDLKSTVKF